MKTSLIAVLVVIGVAIAVPSEAGFLRAFGAAFVQCPISKGVVAGAKGVAKGTAATAKGVVKGVVATAKAVY